MSFCKLSNSDDNQPMICLETFQTDCEVQGVECESVKSFEERSETEESSNVRIIENMEQFEVIEFTPKVYLRRWAVLASYCLLTMSNLASWFSFSAISNIIQRYYGINLVQVNWLAMAFSTVSIFLMIPSYHLLERIGLGMIMILAGFLNALGCCVKYAGYSKPTIGYLLLLIGSILCAIATSAFLFLPSKIAATWFGEKERATAIAIAVSADSFGMALGYFLPTSIVKNKSSLEEVGADIGTLLLSSAVEASVIFIIICITIKDQPQTPPNYSESKKLSINAQSHSAISGYKILLRNKHFLTILNIHGILFSIESIFLVALNELLIGKFPGYERQIGIMASVGLILSIPTSFLVGILLDRTHTFKRVTLVTTGLCSLLTALLSILFYINVRFYFLFATYLAIVAVSCTYYTTAFDHCAELTYPISEAQSGVLLLWIAQVYSLIFEQSGSWVLLYIGAEELLFCVLGLYIIIFILSFFLKNRGPRPSQPNGSSL